MTTKPSEESMNTATEIIDRLIYTEMDFRTYYAHQLIAAALDAERAKLSVAIEALRFYAEPYGEADLVDDDNDYETNPAYPKEKPIPVPGIRARAALQKLEGDET